MGDLEAVAHRVDELRPAADEFRRRQQEAIVLRQKLEAMAITLRVLDGSWVEPEVPMKRRKRPWGDLPTGAFIRTALRVLGTSTEPLSAAEIAEIVAPRVMPGREFSSHEMAHIATVIRCSLRRRRSLIRVTGTHPLRFALNLSSRGAPHSPNSSSTGATAGCD